MELSQLRLFKAVAIFQNLSRAAGRDQVGLTELKDWDFIICQRSVATPLYDAIIQACLEAGFSPRIVSEAVTPHGVIFGVSGGSLVSITFSTMRHFFSRGVVFTLYSKIVDRRIFILALPRTQETPVPRLE